jgi:hypothetical protein
MGAMHHDSNSLVKTRASGPSIDEHERDEKRLFVHWLRGDGLSSFSVDWKGLQTYHRKCIPGHEYSTL